MDKTELLEKYFLIDVDCSGNWDCNKYGYRDENVSYWRRKVSSRITKTMKTEFELVMNTLLPNWESDRTLFSVQSVTYRPDSLCICTHCISDICLLKHPDLADNHGLQVGNDCVHKINPELAKEASKLFNKMRDERREERVRQEFQKELESYESMPFLDIWKSISKQLGITFAKKDSIDYNKIKVKFEKIKKGLLNMKSSPKRMTNI